MRNRTVRAGFGVCLVAAGLIVINRVSPQQASADIPQQAPMRGVSLAGPEFGTDKADFSNENPGVFGKDYTYNTERTTQYFCERGLRLIRIPIRWERIQPELGRDLNPLELARLRVAVGWARKHGGKVIIDLHNYGRYVLVRDGKPRPVVIDQNVGGDIPVSRAHFADLWRRLSQVFENDPTIYAYGIMNEPHDMGFSNWKAISQAAVDAIRANGDGRLILVAGNNWSKAHAFAPCNGAAWINDPCDNIAYEAHCYFDQDASGRYLRSFDEESVREPDLAGRAVDRLNAFAKWCATNKVRGFVGEYSVPGDDPRWLPVLKKFQQALFTTGMAGCYWAGGEWWPNAGSTIQPRHSFQTDAPQMHVLRSE